MHAQTTIAPTPCPAPPPPPRPLPPPLAQYHLALDLINDLLFVLSGMNVQPANAYRESRSTKASLARVLVPILGANFIWSLRLAEIAFLAVRTAYAQPPFRTALARSPHAAHAQLTRSPRAAHAQPSPRAQPSRAALAPPNLGSLLAPGPRLCVTLRHPPRCARGRADRAQASC